MKPADEHPYADLEAGAPLVEALLGLAGTIDKLQHLMHTTHCLPSTQVIDQRANGSVCRSPEGSSLVLNSPAYHPPNR